MSHLDAAPARLIDLVLVPLAILGLGSAGCVSSRDDGTRAPKTAAVADPTASTDAARSSEAEAPEAGALAARQGPEIVTQFSPVAEGACPSATPYAVGGTTVLVMKRDAWTMGPDTVRAFRRLGPPAYDAFIGAMKTTDTIGEVGGIDEAHAWALLHYSTGRGEDASILWYAFPKGHTLETPRGQEGMFGLSHVIAQPDGVLWAFGRHSMYLDIPGDSHDPNAKHDRYFAWSPLGEPLKINLPGPDMANALRMENGELVAAALATSGDAQLRRWSPTRKVDDLVAKGTAAGAGAPELGVGAARAVVLVKSKHAFFNYSNDKLAPSALNARLGDVASWLVTKSDELWVTTADGTLFVEAKNGAVTEEKLPEPARLAGEQSAPWLLAKSGAIHRRDGASWTKLTLPESPWAAETHPPSRLDWLRVIGAETWVATVRTDAGFGRKKPGEVRAFYSSKARPAIFRCGAPFSGETMAAFPPPARPACTTPVVVVAGEKEREQPASYPKLGAALKGDLALGDTLSFVSFGPDTSPVLGIAVASAEVAAAVAKKLASVAPHAPEIVCGAPGERRRLSFDVKTGAFSASP